MDKEKKKILLMLLPFWDPLISSLGISCLKSYLQLHGYHVKTTDANIKAKFRELQNNYFNRLIEYVPESKRRHLYNIDHEVLKNHMMAYLHRKDKKEYVELVKLNPFLTDIANELKQANDSIYWGGYLRVDKQVCDIENTILWRQGGFYRARLGVESGSTRVLQSMNKKITVDKIKSAVRSLAHAGIKTTTMFVIGYPGETEEDFQQTLAIIEELKDDIYEADCNPFWYFPTGQVRSHEWEEKNNSCLLYPESAKEMLILQTRVLKSEPSREETYKRVNRFIQHCNKLRVPNPYSLKDSNKADDRWKKLHKNAVPSILEINSGDTCSDECKKVKHLVLAGNVSKDDGNWGFKLPIKTRRNDVRKYETFCRCFGNCT